MCVCVCVYIYIFVCMCIYVCMFVCVCIYVCMCVYIYIYIYIFGNQRSQFAREFLGHDLRLIVAVQSDMIFRSVKTLNVRSRMYMLISLHF